LATLSINVLGAFLMGLLFTLTLEKLRISGAVRAGILTGGLGSYTTFSTFSIEAYSLFQTGHLVKGGLYIVLSVVLGLSAVVLGVWLAQR
jgi:CrcB protein